MVKTIKSSMSQARKKMLEQIKNKEESEVKRKKTAKEKYKELRESIKEPEPTPQSFSDKFEEELNNFNSLDERRRELIRILDKNQLYYNYANIDDENVRDLVSDNDYEFNNIFYSD